jgi:hypothetical protein
VRKRSVGGGEYSSITESSSFEACGLSDDLLILVYRGSEGNIDNSLRVSLLESRAPDAQNGVKATFRSVGHTFSDVPLSPRSGKFNSSFGSCMSSFSNARGSGGIVVTSPGPPEGGRTRSPLSL